VIQRGLIEKPEGEARVTVSIDISRRGGLRGPGNKTLANWLRVIFPYTGFYNADNAGAALKSRARNIAIHHPPRRHKRVARFTSLLHVSPPSLAPSLSLSLSLSLCLSLPRNGILKIPTAVLQHPRKDSTCAHLDGRKNAPTRTREPLRANFREEKAVRYRQIGRSASKFSRHPPSCSPSLRLFPHLSSSTVERDFCRPTAEYASPSSRSAVTVLSTQLVFGNRKQTLNVATLA